MAAAAKPRKRIVPVLVQSPLERNADFAVEDQTASGASLPSLLTPQLDQKQQSEWASENLGPDRKVFLDLTGASNQEVDWKQLLKDRGVQKPTKAAAKPAENGTGDDPLLLRGRSGRQENTWTRMLAKLEATYCLGALSDAEEEEEEVDAEEASDSGSDSEEEGEGAGKEGEGKGSDGEKGGEGKGSDGEKGGEGKGGKRGGARGPQDYDYFDDFIDDAEFMELLEHDKRKPKHSGFFISKGEIERTEEMLPGFEELDKGKKSGKRKAEEDAGEGGAAKEAKVDGEKKKRKQQEAGEGEEGAEKPAKKKKKIVAEAVDGGKGATAPTGTPPSAKLSIAEQARMAGQMAAAGGGAAAAGALHPQRLGSQPPASAKKRVPYEVPADVAAAIAHIKAVAAQQQPPPPALPAGEGDDSKRHRRSLPKDIKKALATFSPLYLQQAELFGVAAGNRILRELSPALEPFASRTSLGLHLRGGQKEKKGKEVQDVTDNHLKQLIANKVKAAAPAGSDDDFEAPQPPRNATLALAKAAGGNGAAAAAAGDAWQAGTAAAKPAWKAVDRAVQQAVYQYLKDRLRGFKITSQQGKLLTQELYNWFPPNTVGLSDIVSMYNMGERKEKRMAYEAAVLAAAAAQGGVPVAALPAGAPQGPAASDAAAGMAVAAAAAAAGLPAVPAAGMPQPAVALESPAPQQKQQQEQGPGDPGLSNLDPAEGFSVMAMAAARRNTSSPPVNQEQQTAAAVARSAGSQPASAMASPQAPVALQRALVVAADAEVAEAVSHASRAQAPPAAEAAATAPQAVAPVAAAPAPTAPVAPPLVPQVSDEECVAKAVSFGADERVLRGILDSSRSSKYTYAYVRALMLVGPAGHTTAEVARQAKDLGWESWDPEKAKSPLSRATQKDYITHIGKSRFTLRAFPGVVEVARPRLGKQSGSSAPSSAVAESPPEVAALVAVAPAPAPAAADPTA